MSQSDSVITCKSLHNAVINSLIEAGFLKPDNKNEAKEIVNGLLTAFMRNKNIIVLPEHLARTCQLSYERSLRSKDRFPQSTSKLSPLLKLPEESGEVTKAANKCVENRGSLEKVYDETIDLIAMIFRLHEEGDEKYGLKPISNFYSQTN